METQVIDGDLVPVKESPKFEADPMVSFIVPIYNIKPETLKRCLLSLNDQDYENMEIVAVLDGPNPELERVCNSLIYEKKFRLIEIEHGGACKARNEGFKISEGEIVSFFNSDYIAKPGMVRNWVETLLKNKDCGFVYGGYEYATSQRQWYPSKDFDAWLLDVANYIDCGFPLWRKYVVAWDEDCKSLQDWDFWIRVIKTHKIKGFYLGREISYLAEPPRPGGLSMDSGSNWIDRVDYIKNKNSIPKRDILVTSLGASNHGIQIAKMIGADFRDDTIFKPSKYKALYMIGFYMRPTDQVNEHPKILAHFPKEMKKIIHFVGADIYWLRKFPFESLKYLSGALNLSADHILCENEQAQAELLEFGIKSEIVPIPPYSRFEVRPLPEKFQIATLITNKSDFDKYCLEGTLSIIRAMPDVQFASYGDGDADIMYPNLKRYGQLTRDKYEEFVYENSALIRLVRHDTVPMSSTEFMMAGRRVISNIPGECTNYIDTKGNFKMNEWDIFQEGLNAFNWPKTKKKIIQEIRKIKDLNINCVTLGIEDRFNRDKYISKIRELCNV